MAALAAFGSNLIRCHLQQVADARNCLQGRIRLAALVFAVRVVRSLPRSCRQHPAVRPKALRERPHYSTGANIARLWHPMADSVLHAGGQPALLRSPSAASCASRTTWA